MTITVEIPEDIEKRIQQSVAQGDIKAARSLLLETVIPSVEAHFMAGETPKDVSVEEFEARLDELADTFMQYVGSDCQPLSDYATSREAFYEGRPKL